MMKFKTILPAIAILFSSTNIIAQATGTLTDSRDGRTYKTVVIGTQTWASENLNAITFNNGDTIPEAKTEEDWKKAGIEGTPAWCYYDNDHSNGSSFGKLYNWYAVKDPRGIVPKGWHVPSDSEWTIFTNYLTGSSSVKKKKAQKTAVNEKTDDGIKKSGFLGLPGGYRDEEGLFHDYGYDGGWWSSTESDTNDAWGRGLYYLYGNVFRYDFSAQYCYYSKSNGLSIRFMKD